MPISIDESLSAVKRTRSDTDAFPSTLISEPLKLPKIVSVLPSNFRSLFTLTLEFSVER